MKTGYFKGIKEDIKMGKDTKNINHLEGLLVELTVLAFICVKALEPLQIKERKQKTKIKR